MPVTTPPPDLAVLALQPDWSISFHMAPVVIGAIGVVLGIALVYRFMQGDLPFRNFELDEAEFGIGKHKVKFRPNYADKQLAYALWVELSTRKVGLQIDLDHDTIVDIYESWYEFFSISRELIKSIPVSKMNQDSTYKVVNLSIELLNEGLRPHLTRWQALYRRWYEWESRKAENDDSSPQVIQKKFNQFDDLSADLLTVNRKLMAYRRKMRELAIGR